MTSRRLRRAARPELAALPLPDGGEAIYNRISGQTHLCDTFSADVLSACEDGADEEALFCALASQPHYEAVGEALLRKRIRDAAGQLEDLGLLEAAGT